MNDKMALFCQNPFNVLKIIDAINDNFAPLIQQYAPTCPHRDPYSYFMTGSCPVYAEIIHEVFKGYADYYDKPGHILNKIGNYYFDVGGINQEPIEQNSQYQYCEEEYFGMATLPYYRKDDVEDIIKPKLIEVGQQALAAELAKMDDEEKINGKTR